MQISDTLTSNQNIPLSKPFLPKKAVDQIKENVLRPIAILALFFLGSQPLLPQTFRVQHAVPAAAFETASVTLPASNGLESSFDDKRESENYSSSISGTEALAAIPKADDVQFERSPTGRNKGRIPRDPNYGHVGAALSLGVNGLSGDVAFPLSRFFDARIGGSGFRFTHSFQESYGDIQAFAQFAYGKAQMDYYPFAGHVRISPMLVFANYTQAVASVTFTGGKRFDFGDGAFVSSPTDPVRGLGHVDFRHTAPGLTIGLNNFTRGYGAFTFPFEVGAFYVGQPKLQLNFTGTACNGDLTGCEDVQNDPSFQTQLTDERTRLNKDLKYAHFIPVLNFGVAYRF